MTDKVVSDWNAAPAARSDTEQNKQTVFYVQPLIAHYRVEVVESLNRLFKVKLFASSVGVESSGFSRENPACEEFVETRIGHMLSSRINIQSKVVWRIVRERPAAVLIFANVRYLSLWLALIVGRAMGIPVLIHGQGLYRHEEVGFARTICYRIAVALANRYVCYTEASKRSLEEIGCPRDKLVVADNSLTVRQTVQPSEKTGSETGVLFIGRLRDDSNVDTLIEAIGRLNAEGYDIKLHLVGGGEHGERLKSLYGNRDYVVWYGAVFDDSKIASISLQCRIGCYPGAAGLSVVHMFGLSLPPLIHNRLPMHMGPEPGYVENGRTGFYFARDGGVEALVTSLRRIWTGPPEKMRATAAAAYSKYQQLNSPTLGRRLAEIVRAAMHG